MSTAEISALELSTLLQTLPSHVKTLSLDCFDTIVWRRVAQPTDVFFNLQNTERWSRAGVTAALRVKAEQEARRHTQLKYGRTEVSIEAIYRSMWPKADDAEIAAWVAEEVAAEADHCFTFEPVIELIRDAHARGMRVIVVSDTYLSRPQLRQLLQAVLGDDEKLIDQVYCSSELGYAKASGLFQPVLQQERLQPDRVIHLGDNVHADFKAPTRLGMLARHLVHHRPAVEEQLEQRVSAALQFLPELRAQHGVPSLSHAMLAAHPAHEDVAQRIGYTTLGPIFTAFSEFLQREVQALQADGSTVRLAFLLRDGFLPARAYETLTGQSAAMVQVSRFTANAASLRTKDDVLRLLSGSLSEKSLAPLLRQLMLPADVCERILARVKKEAQPLQAFVRLVTREDNLRVTFEQSAALRQRLFTHVQKRTGLQRGETLVLVDLGYSGTVQTRLRDVFHDELDVRLRGLYLIASRALPDQTDRKGLVGPHWADERLVQALTAYIGLFEMMCTKAEPSTVGYTDDGDPVFGAAGTKAQQNEVADQIQQACLRYVGDWRDTAASAKPRRSDLALGWQVAAELGRLIYLPAADEVECLKSFEFDFNLGTDLVLATADLKAGELEFRREGFSMMNRDFATMRISYPMELRYLDNTLATTLIASNRFGLSVKISQSSYRTMHIPLLVANASGHALDSVEAHTTFDGYYSLQLPWGASFDMSLLWGQRLQWLQIDSVEKVSLSDATQTQTLHAGQDFVLDGMTEMADGLIQCTEAGMLYVGACPPEEQGRYLLRVTFRPLVER